MTMTLKETQQQIVSEAVKEFEKWFDEDTEKARHQLEEFIGNYRVLNDLKENTKSFLTTTLISAMRKVAEKTARALEGTDLKNTYFYERRDSWLNQDSEESEPEGEINASTSTKTNQDSEGTPTEDIWNNPDGTITIRTYPNGRPYQPTN